jgi:hypothetical protein
VPRGRRLRASHSGQSPSAAQPDRSAFRRPGDDRGGSGVLSEAGLFSGVAVSTCVRDAVGSVSVAFRRGADLAAIRGNASPTPVSACVLVELPAVFGHTSPFGNGLSYGLQPFDQGVESGEQESDSLWKTLLGHLWSAGRVGSGQVVGGRLGDPGPRSELSGSADDAPGGKRVKQPNVRATLPLVGRSPREQCAGAGRETLPESEGFCT